MELTLEHLCLLSLKFWSNISHSCRAQDSMSIAIAILIRYAEMRRLRRGMTVRSCGYILNQFVDWGSRNFEVRHIVEGIDVVRKRNDNRFDVFRELFRVFGKL
jgi:hypothetical protein